MICYKDKTFCKAYKLCKCGSNCELAYNEGVIKKAVAWWGSEDAPIAVKNKLDCFKPK